LHLAVNYSEEAAALIRGGAIEVDLFKCPDWPDLIASAQSLRPAYVHFPWRAGSRRMSEIDWPAAERVLASTHTPFVNMHLSPSAQDFAAMLVDTCDADHRRAVTEAMYADAEFVAGRFGADRVILENVMWDPGPPWFIPRPALEAHVIREVVSATGCGFCLDLCHARISAHYLRVDEKDYLAALPVGRLRELHLTGIRLGEDGLEHDHYPLTDDDWQWAAWALDRIRTGEWPTPRIIAFEYGGMGPAYRGRSDPTVLAHQVPRLLSLTRPG